MQLEGPLCIPRGNRMIKFHSTGDFSKTIRFLQRSKNLNYEGALRECAERGVAALKSATPVDSGKTAESWDYEIHKTANGYNIYWTNSNVNDGVSIAVILQYGHGTGWGGYVQGRDYINPAIRPIFDEMANNAWKEVTKE